MKSKDQIRINRIVTGALDHYYHVVIKISLFEQWNGMLSLKDGLCQAMV